MESYGMRCPLSLSFFPPLAYSTWHIYFEIHPCCWIHHYSFWLLVVFHCMDIPQFVFPFTCLDYFQVGGSTNKDIMNIYIQIFVWTYAIFSLGKIYRNWMAGSSRRYILTFKENAELLSILDFYHWHIRVLVPPRLYQYVVVLAI